MKTFLGTKKLVTLALIMVSFYLAACSELSEVTPNSYQTSQLGLFHDDDIEGAKFFNVSSLENIDEIEESPLTQTLAEQSVSSNPASPIYLAAIRHDGANAWEIHRYQPDSQEDLLVYSGERQIDSVSISQDGNTIAAIMASEVMRDGLIASNLEVYRFSLNPRLVERFSVTPHDERHISISGDAKVWVWESKNLINGKRTVYERSFEGAVASDRMFGGREAQLEARLEPTGRYLTLIRYSDDGQYSLMIYDRNRRRFSQVLLGNDRLSQPSLSSDLSRLSYERITASGQRQLILHQLSTAQEKTLLNLNTPQPFNAQLSASGQYLSYGLKNQLNGSLWFYDIAKEQSENAYSSQGFYYPNFAWQGDVTTPNPQPQPTIWQPKPGTSWQWQLQGTINTSFDVDMYDIDLFDTPVSVIEELHGDGRIVICYFSAGSYEAWRPDAASFPSEVKADKMAGWDELWLDIRHLDLLGPIMKARLDLAVEKGCDGVEPDNVDAYSNRTGRPLTAQDQLSYNIFLAEEAHKRGLSIGLKNDLDQVLALEPYFDWALNEQCFSYQECNLLLPFIQNGKAVFGVEYELSPNRFCNQANSMNMDFLKKTYDLTATRQACR
ncbi:MAG: endo alpha-1,4 polygalactosaminidase [Deinococcales bacterium]